MATENREMPETEKTPVNYRTLLERLYSAVTGKHIMHVKDILTQNKDIVYIDGAWRSAQVYNGSEVGLYLQWDSDGYIFSADLCKAEDAKKLQALREDKTKAVSVRPDVFIPPYDMGTRKAINESGKSLEGLVRAAEAAA